MEIVAIHITALQVTLSFARVKGFAAVQDALIVDYQQISWLQ